MAVVIVCYLFLVGIGLDLLTLLPPLARLVSVLLIIIHIVSVECCQANVLLAPLLGLGLGLGLGLE